MKPKEKAKELIEKYSDLAYNKIVCKQCALIAVDEILNDNPNVYDSDRLNHKYWKEVKREISLL
jgi:hypothetical protein